MTRFQTVAQIKAAHTAAGKFFFSPGAMRFFRSRVLPGVYGGRYFITSEQFVSSEGRPSPRQYNVREVSEDGSDIGTAPGGGWLDSLAEAKALARTLAAESQEKGESL